MEMRRLKGPGGNFDANAPASLVSKATEGLNEK